MTIFAGIDPGLTGAVAIYDGTVWAVHDMPLHGRTYGKGNEINAYHLAELLAGVDQALVEIQSYFLKAGSKMGAVSAGKTGEGYGIIKGILGAYDIPRHDITSQSWKKKAGLIRKDKDASRGLAIRLFPYLADELKRKKDHGRAEAVLIGHFGKKT